MLSELRSLSKLIFPVACIGCGAAQVEICPSCSGLWSAPPILSRLDSLPLAFTARYQPRVQRFILAAKEDGSKVARSALAHSLSASLRTLMAGKRCEGVLLVPIPSHRATIRARGRDHGLLLARAVSQNFGSEVDVAPLLRVIRPVADQTGLNPSQRAANLAGAFSADSQLIRRKGRAAIVMVDDVITSGTSFREGARALTSVGCPPVAAISACASARFLPIRLHL